MFPYIVFITFISYYYYTRRPVCMLWTLIIFAVLRYDVGWDYASYVESISNPSTWDDAETSRHSFLWRELFRFAYNINSPHIGIITPNILTYIFVYLGLKKINLSKQVIADALFVYATWSSFYLGSFSTIRQALAMSVGLLLFAYVQNRQFAKSFILYVLAILLHPSAAVLIIIYPTYFIRSQLNFIWILSSVVIICSVLFSLQSILMMLSFIEMDQYEVYLNWNDSFGGKIIYVNIALVIYLLIVYLITKHINDIQRQSFFYTILSFVGNIAAYFIGLSNVINRIFLYFIIFMIIILLPSINKFKYKNYFRLIASVCLIIYFFTYLYITRSGVASSGYIPYKFIFLQ